MGQIDSSLIKKVLELYKPEYRWLKTASEQYPLFNAIFEVQRGTYSVLPFEHLTNTETELCLNQFAYVSIAHMVQSSHEKFKKYPLKKFYELQKEGAWVFESNKRFKKIIDNGKKFHGKLIFKNIKRMKNLLIIKTDFEFENKSYFGTLGLASKINY